MPNPFCGMIPSNQALGTATAGGPAAAPLSAIQRLHHDRLHLRLVDLPFHADARGKAVLPRLHFLVSYTNSKMIDDGAPGRNAPSARVPNFQNNNNRKLERSLSSQEDSQRLSIAAAYELPFGPGKRFLSSAPSVVKPIVGGGSLTGSRVPSGHSPRVDHVRQ